MKLAFLSQFHSTQETGISRQSYYIVQYLEKLQIAFSLYTWESISKPFMKWGKYTIQSWKDLITDFDVLLYYGEWWAFPSLKIFNVFNCPMLWYCPLDTEKPQEDFINFSSNFDLIIPVSNWNRKILENYSDNVVSPIPHTVALADKQPQEKSENDKIRIGTVLRPQRRKNIFALCEFLMQSDSFFDVISEVSYCELNLSDAFNQFNIDFRIRQNLNARQLRQFYDSLDLYVSVSMGEGFDLPVGEALLANKCVLVSDIPAHREFGIPKNNLVRVSGEAFSAPGWSLTDTEDMIRKYEILKSKNFPSLNIDMNSYLSYSVGPLWGELLNNLKEILSYTI